jgi:hypothetical protein
MNSLRKCNVKVWNAMNRIVSNEEAPWGASGLFYNLTLWSRQHRQWRERGDECRSKLKI